MNSLAAGSAFVAGLLSAGHCFGMCGGIVGAFSLGGAARNAGFGARLRALLSYNAGRIFTYAALGAVAGALGATLGDLLPPEVARRGGRLLAALFLVGLGLFLAGRPQLLQPVERLGARLWRRVEPLGRPWLQASGFAPALALGLVWGFLPCGLVYSMLAMASLAGGAANGALVMLAFGAGTLPALFAAGLAAARLRELARSTLLRRSAAAIYVAAGVWLAVSALTGRGMSHGSASGAGHEMRDGARAVGADTCPPPGSAL